MLARFGPYATEVQARQALNAEHAISKRGVRHGRPFGVDSSSLWRAKKHWRRTSGN